MDNKTIALRRLGSKEQEILSLDDSIALLENNSLPPDVND